MTATRRLAAILAAARRARSFAPLEPDLRSAIYG
jgi:hypothetical protein